MARRPSCPLAQLRPSRSRLWRSKRRGGRQLVREMEEWQWQSSSWEKGEEMERSRAAAVFGVRLRE
uniref:Uncharacterized protein n=1 Tax=Oryza sativa subsp. japonica TaxID=39947 RepID=Q5Z4F9_ORYSJ|nr:hypothetical protein [Oryza sativa Japonica Group]